MNDTNDILEYYDRDGHEVADSLHDIAHAHWAKQDQPQPPPLYRVTVRQFLVSITPLTIYWAVVVLGPLIAVKPLLGDSVALAVVVANVYAWTGLVAGRLVLLPLGDWLAGIPIVVDAE